jgi:ribosomal protein RSM22 (predicted rRNA methylase)
MTWGGGSRIGSCQDRSLSGKSFKKAKYDAISGILMASLAKLQISSNHSLNQPIHSIPDAQAQRRHDSRATQWSFFKFPCKDSYCQKTKYGTHDFSCHHLFTSSLSLFPHLKNDNLFDLISIVSPKNI